jgi:hypothetical protein
MALKQAASPLNSAAPAPDAGNRPTRCRREDSHGGSAGDNFKGAEKRPSPRYKYEGSAEVREEGCDVRTWATFTDVSLHGCEVERRPLIPREPFCT